MCLVLAAILGSYLVRQGQFYLVPVRDIFFYDFFTALTVSRHQA